jgi:hypothetical protein
MRSGHAVLEAIDTKKSGGELNDDLIREVVAGYTAGDVPDYQMASLLMAIFVRGMDYAETLALTRAMADSGERYSFPECVDKHSTGGVGDKVSLTALPIAAACGAPVAKLSGRGLGTTGGTIDKLESIPGFSVNLSQERFGRQVEEVGLAIVEAGDLAPADKAIYALRDTTGTVDSLPLIGSSIVSKKVATGAGHLLYDVKRGSGAFMKTTEQARELAELLVALSEDLGIQASGPHHDMDHPLGSAVGNALEVRESVRLLKAEPVRRPFDRVTPRRRPTPGAQGHPGSRGPVAGAIYSVRPSRSSGSSSGPRAANAGALVDLPVSSAVREVAAPRRRLRGALRRRGRGSAALALGAGRQRTRGPRDPLGRRGPGETGRQDREGAPSPASTANAGWSGPRPGAGGAGGPTSP